MDRWSEHGSTSGAFLLPTSVEHSMRIFTCQECTWEGSSLVDRSKNSRALSTLPASPSITPRACREIRNSLRISLARIHPRAARRNQNHHPHSCAFTPTTACREIQECLSISYMRIALIASTAQCMKYTSQDYLQASLLCMSCDGLHCFEVI